jgi:hypothetical protein
LRGLAIFLRNFKSLLLEPTRITYEKHKRVAYGDTE